MGRIYRYASITVPITRSCDVVVRFLTTIRAKITHFSYRSGGEDNGVVSGYTIIASQDVPLLRCCAITAEHQLADVVGRSVCIRRERIVHQLLLRGIGRHVWHTTRTCFGIALGKRRCRYKQKHHKQCKHEA